MEISKELDMAAFEYTEGEDINFVKSVTKGIEEEVVIDYLNEKFPDKSFTEKEIKEVKKYIVDYAKYMLTTLQLDLQSNFENEINSLVVNYKEEKGLDDISMSKILLSIAINLLP